MTGATLDPGPAPEVVAARLEDLWRRVRATGRDPDTVRVVAVTKGFGAPAVMAARAAGVRDIGENYAAELLAKASLVRTGEAGETDGVRWHYLGAVQRRRVRALAPVVDVWQALARAVEGEAIAAQAPGAQVLVEVDVSGLPGRNGCPPSSVPDLVRSLEALDLDVRGLMTVAPPGPPEAARAGFRTTARLAAELGLAEISMGMSADLEVALSEGATMVRVGRALFGERPPPAAARLVTPAS